MKGLMIFLLLFLLNGCCSSQINDTDSQVSENIKKSKQYGCFLKQYAIAYTTDTNIVLEEAWVEKGWFYKVDKGKVVHHIKSWCQLCFTLKQTPQLIYSFKNMDHWLMEEPTSERYVGGVYSANKGIYEGVYELSFNDCNVADTISLDLIDYNNASENVVKNKVGTLVFKAVGAK